MKKLALLLVGIAIILPATVFAGVEGSDHDLSAGAASLCTTCHLPHNALGDNLWASTPDGTFAGVQDLCYTCHDGSVTSVGLTTAFDANLEQHVTVGTDCSGAGACHDVHNQNPNLTGRFTVAGVVETNNSYCETCHDATPFGGGIEGDHTAGTQHFVNGGTFTCNQCHTLHGATAQTTNPGTLTNPILLADNQPAANYGMFCATCHSGTAPTPAIPGTGGVAATDIQTYWEPLGDGTEQRHPTATPLIAGCDECHDVHASATTPELSYLLLDDNTDSAYCLSCHLSGGSVPGIGGNTHFTGIPTNVNMNNGLNPALPWANQIDEDGNVGIDWPTASANTMVCETCHSVHTLGNTVGGSSYFLRHENGDLNEICSACHVDN